MARALDYDLGWVKFRVTRLGMYLYHRRFTLCFTWGSGWVGIPEFSRNVLGESGWALWWGWWSLELLCWGKYDPWGESAGESMRETWEWLEHGLLEGFGIEEEEEQ